jgi:hypothetical protein
MRKTLILFVLLALLGCAAPRRAHAQFLGYVADQSVAQVVFTAQAANGASGILNNIGQASHFVLYCDTGFKGTLNLEASPDGTFSTPIVIATATYGQNGVVDNACHVLQAGGYYQTVRLRMLNYVAGSMNAWYTAIGAPISVSPTAFNSNGATAPVACDNASFQNALASATTALQNLLAGTRIYLCGFTLSFSAATTTGTLRIGYGTDNSCSGFFALWGMNVTASSPQFVSFGGPLGALLSTPAVGQSLCMSIGGITASTAVSLSYAQF